MLRRLSLAEMVRSDVRLQPGNLPLFMGPLLEARGAQLERAMSLVVSDIGFDSFLYGSMVLTDDETRQMVLVTTPVQQESVRHNRLMYSEADPRVRVCLRQGAPFLWDATRTFGPLVDAFFKDAAVHGLRSGIAVAVGGEMGERASFAVNSSKELLPQAEELELAVGRTYILATYFHGLFFHNLRRRHAFIRSEQPAVSKRELEVLTLVARGQSSKRIGRELGISESTANYHIASVKQKLGVHTRSQAIAQAVQTGLIR